MGAAAYKDWCHEGREVCSTHNVVAAVGGAVAAVRGGADGVRDGGGLVIWHDSCAHCCRANV